MRFLFVGVFLAIFISFGTRDSYADFVSGVNAPLSPEGQKALKQGQVALALDIGEKHLRELLKKKDHALFTIWSLSRLYRKHDWCERGQKYFSDVLSEGLLTDLKKQKREHEELQTALGLCAHINGDHDLASASFQQAGIDRDQTTCEALVSRPRFFFDDGAHLNDSRLFLAEQSILYPKCLAPYLVEARILLFLDRAQEALDVLERMSALGKNDAQFVAYHAWAAFRVGDVEKAAQLKVRAFALNPDLPYDLLKNLLERDRGFRSDPGTAINKSQQADLIYFLQPDDVYLGYISVVWEQIANGMQLPEQSLDTFINRFPDFYPAYDWLAMDRSSWLMRGEKAQSETDYSEAWDALSRLRVVTSKGSRVDFLLSLLSLRNGDHEAALELLERGVSANPRYLTAHADRVRNGQIRSVLWNFERDLLNILSDRVLQEPKLEDQNRARALFLRGLAKDLAAKQEEALQDYQLAITLDPQLYKARLRRAFILMQKDKSKSAIRELNELYDLTEGDTKKAVQHFLAWGLSGDLIRPAPDAERALDLAQKLYQMDKSILNEVTLARAHAVNGDVGLAQEMIGKILSPTNGTFSIYKADPMENFDWDKKHLFTEAELKTLDHWIDPKSRVLSLTPETVRLGIEETTVRRLEKRLKYLSQKSNG